MPAPVNPSHNPPTSSTEKKPPRTRGDFFDPTWRISQVNNFPHKKPCASKKSVRGVQRGRCSSVPFGIFLPFIKNAKSLYDS